ncbi:MAG TPA: septum formation initiator family protein [Bryobacteraceae bacterium]|nr:septum formation initiator family protein [Bryobacteraceae bacterium]
MGPFFEALIRRNARRAGYALALAVVAAYGWMALRGPQGVGALLERHREMRTLEEQNAEAARAVEQRKERIRRLQESQSEQDMEIRKQLKMIRPGETTFILPDPPKDSKDGAKPDPDSLPHD